MTDQKVLPAGSLYLDEAGQLHQIITVGYHPKSTQQMVIYQGLYAPFKIYVEFMEDFFSHMREPAYLEQTTPAKEISAENSQAINPYTIDFLEADSYEDKLNILVVMKEKMNHKMLDDISVCLDLNLENQSLEEKYENIRNHLLTLKRYEGRRRE